MTLTSFVSMMVLAVLCVTGSFAVGIQSAGEMKTVASLAAVSTEIVGDMNSNGQADLEDVIIILEIAQGTQTASAEQMRLDPNGDGTLTVDDALMMLRNLSAH